MRIFRLRDFQGAMSSEQLPYFFLKSYAHHIESAYGSEYNLAVDDDMNGMPFIISKGRFLTHGQIQHAPTNLINGASLLNEKKFLDDFLDLSVRNRICDRFVQGPVTALFQYVPPKASACAFGSYRIVLSEYQNAAAIFNNFHQKHRNVIKNAQNKNVQITFGRQQLETFFLLHRDTMRRSGQGVEAFSFFESLYDHLGDDHIMCCACYHEGIAQGAALIPLTQYAAYYVYGASADKVSVTGANNLLQWCVIQQLFDRKIRMYDFVGARLSDVSGTKLEGIQKFKSRFGTELIRGFLWKKNISLFKTSLVETSISLKARLKGKSIKGDIIDQELRKSKKD